MKRGKCPKCDARDVRQVTGDRYRNYHQFAAFSGVRVCDYICGQCGYMESYVVPEEWSKVRERLPPVQE